MSDTTKGYFDLTKKEIAERKKLTAKEEAAVDALKAAVKALPKSLCLTVEDDFWDKPGLKISKRITQGSCVEVAFVRKASLHF